MVLSFLSLFFLPFFFPADQKLQVSIFPIRSPRGDLFQGITLYHITIAMHLT